MDRVNDGDLWLALGLLGNAIFGTRFIVQWIASERAGRSTVPVAFWYLSVAGSLIMLVYTIHIGVMIGWKKALPLVLSYAPNLVPYIRNLMLIHKEARARVVEVAADRPRPLGAEPREDVADPRG